MAKYYRFILLIAVLGLSYGMMPVKNACAQLDESLTNNSSPASNGTIAKQTCDSQVWRTMEARARIETEREMMQNQNLIFKPDSILNYVCFDKFAGHAAEHVGVLFTHTTYFGGEIIKSDGDNSMGKAMQSAVVAAMKTYINSNFPHSYLGGRGSDMGLSTPTVTDISGKGGTYSCSQMSEVWAKAKCMNFMHTANFALNDGFYPFLNITAQTGGESVEGYEGKTDTRKFPTACSGTPITGSTWKDMYRLSRNEEDFGKVDKLYQYGTPLNKAFTEVRKKVDADPACGDGKAIKTGIKVILSPGSTSSYEDGVCTNPGCFFTKDGQCTTNKSGNISGTTDNATSADGQNY